jgi:hypothetical protein
LTKVCLYFGLCDLQNKKISILYFLEGQKKSRGIEG